jgi:hypothetical protein
MVFTVMDLLLLSQLIIYDPIVCLFIFLSVRDIIKYMFSHKGLLFWWCFRPLYNTVLFFS